MSEITVYACLTLRNYITFVVLLVKKVLIIDDNKDILSVLEANLCAYLPDCDILTASSAHQGMDIMRTHTVDMVVTDLNMPQENGFQFIERVQREKPGVRFCVMTGDTADSIRRRLSSLGVTGIVEKPFLYSTLADMILKELAKERSEADGPVGCRDKPC